MAYYASSSWTAVFSSLIDTILAMALSRGIRMDGGARLRHRGRVLACLLALGSTYVPISPNITPGIQRTILDLWKSYFIKKTKGLCPTLTIFTARSIIAIPGIGKVMLMGWFCY